MSLRLTRSTTTALAADSKWQTALQTAAKSKVRGEDGTVLILGNANTGKSTLIRSLQLHAMGGSERVEADHLYQNTGGAQLTDCAVLPARPSTEPSADYSSTSAACFLLQKKELSEVLSDHLAQQLLTYGLKTMTILITVNLADMIEAYEHAEDWLKFLVEYLTKLVVEADQSRAQPGQTSLLNELTELKEKKLQDQRDLHHENESADVEGEVHNEDEEPDDTINFGVQVIVCGCRSDALPSASVGQSRTKISDESIFVAHLRNLCHRFGATLLMVNAKEEQHVNCAKLYNLICAPIVGEAHSWTPVTDPTSRLFIPAGSESSKALLQLAKETNANLDAPIQTEIRPEYKGDAHQEQNADTGASGTLVSLTKFLSQMAASDPSVLGSIEPLEKQQSEINRSSSNRLKKDASMQSVENVAERRQVSSRQMREEAPRVPTRGGSGSPENVERPVERRREKSERTSAGSLSRSSAPHDKEAAAVPKREHHEKQTTATSDLKSRIKDMKSKTTRSPKPPTTPTA